MGKNNGYPPKVELKPNEEFRLKILRPVKVGKNGNDPYYLYRVANLDTGEEQSLFAPGDVHSVIQDQKLGVGSVFLLKRIQNGKSSKLELSLVSVSTPEPKEDSFKDIMRRSILDAIQLKQEIQGIDLTHEDLRALSSSLFIARTKSL